LENLIWVEERRPTWRTVAEEPPKEEEWNKPKEIKNYKEINWS
jgi:hypothetical protein